MSNSTSIVPLVLWGKHPPAHTVSCIACTYDQKTIITGTIQGQLGVWDLRHIKDSQLKVCYFSLIRKIIQYFKPVFHLANIHAKLFFSLQISTSTSAKFYFFYVFQICKQ